MEEVPLELRRAKGAVDEVRESLKDLAKALEAVEALAEYGEDPGVVAALARVLRMAAERLALRLCSAWAAIEETELALREEGS